MTLEKSNKHWQTLPVSSLLLLIFVLVEKEL